MKLGKSVENPLTLEELMHECNGIKKDIQQLKQRVELLETRKEQNEEEEVKDQEEFINSIEKYIEQKWLSKILLKIKNYAAQHTALIDSEADVN